MTMRAMMFGPMTSLLTYTPRIIAVAALLLAAATSALADEPMGAGEIRDMITGNTLIGKTEKGYAFHVYHNPNGKMSGQARLTYYDVGTWEVTDDGKYCRQWKKWRRGWRDCFLLSSLGEDQFRLKAINIHYDSTFRIVKGDPEGLNTWIK